MKPAVVVEVAEMMNGEVGNERADDELLDCHPDHRADLAASGLTAATIRELNIHTVPPRFVAKHLGFEHSRLESVLCFPYPGCGGFCRDKLFPPITDSDGHSIRYLQRKGTDPRLYIPPLVRSVLADPSVTLYLTEGEKKAAKACQEGLPCIGLGGLWNWVKDGRPVEDLNLIIWKERRVVLVPDNDVWQARDDLLRAVYALGAELERRGAFVRVLRIPGEMEA
ncbi:MAG TPA: DUF3854 domain-containing protein [Candidatus Binatia bacterium]|nr:DUF3854 domain-containing protein [Candidatus Binatia bacterium]